MKDQDLQRLFDYVDAPSHSFHSIKRREAVADVLGQWPVLGEANERVREVLAREPRAVDGEEAPTSARDALGCAASDGDPTGGVPAEYGPIVDVPGRLR